MKAVLQRVTDASVRVDGECVGSITKGLLVYLGVCETDDQKDLDYITRKIGAMRMFTDDEGKMNRSVHENGGEVLLVSQFTLCAITTKGNRPSFNPAAHPQKASEMYEEVARKLRESGLHVETGIFGASMRVGYVNEGPVTIILDSDDIQK